MSDGGVGGKRKRRVFFQRWREGDFIASPDVQEMNGYEKMLYRTMLQKAHWMGEKGLPTDDVKCARLLEVPLKFYRKWNEKCLKKFRSLNERLRNPVVDNDLSLLTESCQASVKHILDTRCLDGSGKNTKNQNERSSGGGKFAFARRVRKILGEERPDFTEKDLDDALGSAVNARDNPKIKNWGGTLRSRIKRNDFRKFSQKDEKKARRHKKELQDLGEF